LALLPVPCFLRSSAFLLVSVVITWLTPDHKGHDIIGKSSTIFLFSAGKQQTTHLQDQKHPPGGYF
jgi:hypothetical protein